MLPAIWRICFFECVLALRALGLSASTATHWMVAMVGMSLFCISAKAKRGVRFDLRLFEIKLLGVSGSAHSTKIASRRLVVLAALQPSASFAARRSRLRRDTSSGGTSPAGPTV
jgi:hypothetical protein